MNWKQLPILIFDFADDTFEGIFFNENIWISIKISLTFVPNGPNQQYPNIGSDKGLVPSRPQAIVRSNDGSFTNAYTYMCHATPLG